MIVNTSSCWLRKVTKMRGGKCWRKVEQTVSCILEGRCVSITDCQQLL